MKREDTEITEEMKETVHPQLLDQLLFWESRAKHTEMFMRLEDLWALQYLWKYKALRRVGFGKLTALIMTIKVMK